MSNTTSLYSNTSSGNATVPANNNTSLYNATGVPQTINNNISVTGNIFAAGYISAGGNVYGANLVTTGNVYAGNIIGNIVGNLVLSGGNTEVIFNNNDSACSSPAFTFNSASNVMAVTGAITATGNITGNYILGNGSQLTGLPATYGNSNVTTLLSGFGSNTVSTTGNITAGYFLGDGSQLTNLPAGNYSNANVANFLPTYSGAITANTVSATGNVTGNYILGDGSQLTNLPIPGVYGNTQVASFLAAFGSNVVSTTGNVTAGYLLGNGSQLTGLPATYGNANVATFLAAFGSNSISTTGNVTAGYVAANGSLLTNITGGNVTGQVANALVAGTVYTAAQPNITSVGTVTSLTSSGNITGNYIIGNGSQLTNLPVQPGTYSNSNVAAYLPIYTGDYAGGNMSLTGNVTAAVLKTSGATGNITGVNYVSANFYLGDGGQLSNITSSYGNAQVATFLNAFGSNTISTSGNITGGNIIGNIQAPGANTLIPFNNDGVLSSNSNFTYNQATNLLTVNGGQIQAGNFNAGSGQVQALTGNLIQINSTTISASGNITGANIIGDGQFLTNLPGANVTGSVAQANVANTANAVAGGNVSGQVANALVAGTVYTNAQPNITSVGTLSSLSVTGNIATGGILTDNYYYANGAPFSGGGGTYGDANVNTLLAAWGSNALSTTGNVTSGYVAGNGSLLTNLNGANVTGTVANATFATSAGTATSATTAGTVTANAQANITSVGTLSSLSVTGDATSGNLLTGGLITATGNITGNYFIGNGSQLTGISAAPGGSDSQIQYNNGGAFGGNAAMTFNDATGDILLGNVAINGQRILPGNTGNLDLTLVTGNANPWQVRVGNSFNGNTNWAYNVFSPGFNFGTGPGSRILQSDVMNLSNANMRFNGIGSQNYINFTANITNNNSRYQGLATNTAIMGGASGNTHLGTNPFNFVGVGAAFTVGNVNANLSAGNTTVNYVSGLTSTTNVGAGSTVANAFGVINNYAYVAGTGNITNMVGFTSYSSSAPANANIIQSNNISSFYHAGFTATIPLINNGNIVRMATNYHAFRNDDDLARSRLGLLERFHELNANTATTTGTVNISKNDGQVQTIYPTGNVTIGTFSNFVTRVLKPDATYVNTADTVTLVIQQGATPYTVTMPTGNTAIRYASGVTTVGATANTTTMISVTGVYDYGTAANEYLVTISPEFS